MVHGPCILHKISEEFSWKRNFGIMDTSHQGYGYTFRFAKVMWRMSVLRFVDVFNFFQKANQWRWDIYITVWFRWSANWTLRKWGRHSSDLQYIRIMWMYTAVLYNETGAFLLFLIRLCNMHGNNTSPSITLRYLYD